LISFRKSFNDLDRLEELEKREALTKTILDSYALAIHAAAHYAIEVDPALAACFRKHLQVIEEQCRAADSPDQVRAVQSSFRGELRQFHDKSAEQLKKMRNEIETATAAMLTFADSVASNGENHEQAVLTQLRGLESTARCNSIDEIRGGIGAAVSRIESSVEQIHRGNQLLIAQLQDEIRSLHQQFAVERKALYTDRDSGAWNRQKIDTHLDNLLRQNQPFCLLLVCVRNFKRLETQHSRMVLEGTLKAIIRRFNSITGEDAVIGRWSEDQFAAVLDVQPGQAISISAEATRKLSGYYAVQENGLSQRITVQAAAGIIEGPAGADPSKFHEKLTQLAGAISGG
jgi:GGDEF domain-containing protein